MAVVCLQVETVRQVTAVQAGEPTGNRKPVTAVTFTTTVGHRVTRCKSVAVNQRGGWWCVRPFVNNNNRPGTVEVGWGGYITPVTGKAQRPGPVLQEEPNHVRKQRAVIRRPAVVERGVRLSTVIQGR